MRAETGAEITWCPGCTNFGIYTALRKFLDETGREDKVIVTGIGCHAKIYDYVDVSGYYSIHGRVVPAMVGIKFARPDLTVMGFAGDGDSYAEGVSHLVAAARLNPDVVLSVHNNQVFALTVSQPTPTSYPGFKTRVTPGGVGDTPLNPIKLMLAAGATFVARAYALHIDRLVDIWKMAVKHRGFAFIDVIQPCITFNDTRRYMEERMYYLEEPLDLKGAMKKAGEWSYSMEPNAKIPMGVFYVEKRPTLEEVWGAEDVLKRNPEFSVREVLKVVK